MTKAQISTEEKKSRAIKVQKKDQSQHANNPDSSMVNLQKLVGNRAVQRLLAQRSGATSTNQSFEVEDETAQRIERERGGGEALDSSVQEQMGAAMGYDFNQVKVHASPEADALNRELGAEAFTTGNDIYFREGAYDPGSSGGQELLAHEMTHVVQQSSGLVGGGGTKMTVNAPDDSYEKNADDVARGAISQSNGSTGAVQTKELQMQELPEEEEKVKKKGILGEEEEVQMRRVQRQEVPEEEEEVQMRRVQRQETSEEEEKVKKKGILGEEEEVQTKRSHKPMRGKTH